MPQASKAPAGKRLQTTSILLAASAAQVLYVFAILTIFDFDRAIMIGAFIGALIMALALSLLLRKGQLTLPRAALLAAVSSVTYVVASVLTAEIWDSVGASLDAESLGTRFVFTFMVFGDAWASFVFSFLACWVVLIRQDSR
ncbi:hypothetical protein ACF046_05520 [Glutamicibacter creatinolyticus]|uniref:hypothetical protein n=1 Tax=Glutamicibacter creatinolyticus TaxID=162496 RepID=UPI0033F5CA91